MTLLSQYRAEQRTLKTANTTPDLKKRRMTVTLPSERDGQLEQIAQARGIEVSALMSEVIEQWLINQTNT